MQMQMLMGEVAYINNLVGNVANPSPKTLAAAADLIASELEELIAGIISNDETEVRDGIADVLFTIAGMYGRMGWFTPLTFEVDGEITVEDLTFSKEYFDGIDAGVNVAIVEPVVKAMLARTAAVVWKLGKQHEYPVLEDFEVVIKNNRQKFDSNWADACQTAQKYLNIGVRTRCLSRGDISHDGSRLSWDGGLYITFSDCDQFDRDGKRYPEGKWLKSHRWREPKFRNLDTRATKDGSETKRPGS